LGFLLADLVSRAFFVQEAPLDVHGRRLPWGGLDRGSVRLLQYMLIFTLLTTLIAVLGATSYSCLADDGIVYRSSILGPERRYSWSDVTKIETACWYNRGQQRKYELKMRDGTTIELLESYSVFLNAYPSVGKALNGVSYKFDHQRVTPGCESSLSPSWRRILMSPPTKEVSGQPIRVNP
jgi:hypothetical protein